MSSRVAFDLDGTLTSCRERQVAVAAHELAAHGLALDADGFWTAKRGAMSTKAALVATGVPEAIAAMVAASWVTHVEDPEWLALDALFPDALDAVRATTEPVILTARRERDRVLRQVENLGLRPLVAEVVVVDPFAAAREKAEQLRRLGATVLIGDTESDCNAAAKADVRFLAVTCGQRDEHVLWTAGARELFSSAALATRAFLGT